MLKFKNLVKSAQNQFTSAIKEVKTALEDDQQDDADYERQEELGVLWEAPEHVNLCRGCSNDFQMPIIRRKHHCRRCGGVYCDDCCPDPESRVVSETSKKAKKVKQVNPLPYSGIKVCMGCYRGEVPGEHIQLLIRNQIEVTDRRKKGSPDDDLTKAFKTVTKAAHKVANHLGIQVSNLPPSVPLQLSRTKLYPDTPTATQKGAPSKYSKPPNSGYFEFTNKHTTMCAIKVLLPGGDRKYEVPRPCYFALPPGQSLSGEFDSELDRLELIVLYNNPNPILKEKRLVYDTRARNVGRGDISDSAKIELFNDVSYFDLPSKHCNGILYMHLLHVYSDTICIHKLYVHIYYTYIVLLLCIHSYAINTIFLP